MKTIKLIAAAILLSILGSCEKEEIPIAQDESKIESTDFKGLRYTKQKPLINFILESKGHQMGGFAGHETTLFNGYIWLVGGDNSHTPPWTNSSQVWRSHNGKNWQLITAGIFEKRRNHSLIVFNNKMWLIGGINNSGDVLSDIWNTVDGTNWNRVNSLNPLIEIGQNNSKVFNNRIFVLRGNGVVNQEVWSSTDGANWRLETDNAFPVRSHYKTVVHHKVLYVIGGYLRDDVSRTNEIWGTKDGRNWFKRTPSTSIFEPRINHTVTAHNGTVWVIGGNDWVSGGASTFYGDIWYSRNMKRWHRYNQKTPFDNGIQSATSLIYNNKLWVFGGYQPDGSMASILSDKIWSMD